MRTRAYCARRLYSRRLGACLLILVISVLSSLPAGAQQANNPNAPAVKKIEPPNWWVGLTPDVMLLLSGKNLEATHVRCNLPEINVSRTQSAANGDYLFVWLKFSAGLKSGTAVCRITTPKGETTFELPIAARKQILGRNQGLSLDDVLYLIVPDRFANGDPTNDEPTESPGSHERSKPRAYHGGDLRGIREHLQYLKELDVTTLELTSIVKNGASEDLHGYGAVDLYAVDPHLGTLQEYQELVQAAHKEHMKVFFDAAPNHVGLSHPWVSNSPMPDWFYGRPTEHLSSFLPLKESFYGGQEKKEPSSDLLEALEDPHALPQYRKNITDGWFLRTSPDLNTENPLVAQYLLQNSIWWAESSGLDGYRVDTVPFVSREFWQEWHQGLRRIYPRLSTIGEVFHRDPEVTSFFAGGRKGWDGVDTQFTTVFDSPLYFVLRNVLVHGSPAGGIADILRQDSLYPHPEYLAPFFGNHEVTRFAGERGATPAKMRLALGLTLTLRGIPELYYGDEIGLSGDGDLDHDPDFPAGLPGEPQIAFTREGRTREQSELLGYAQSLLRVRRAHAALRSGKLWHLASDDSSYVFMRETEEERLVVAFHNGTTNRELKIFLRDSPAQEASGISLLLGDAQAELAGRELRLELPAQSLTIFELH
jgi:neopullulanase